MLDIPIRYSAIISLIKIPKKGQFLIIWIKYGLKWGINIFLMDFEGCGIYKIKIKLHKMKEEMELDCFVYIFLNLIYAIPSKSIQKIFLADH